MNDYLQRTDFDYTLETFEAYALTTDDNVYIKKHTKDISISNNKFNDGIIEVGDLDLSCVLYLMITVWLASKKLMELFI